MTDSQHEYDRPGLPTTQQLQSYRIWDSYFTPSFSHPGADGSRRILDDINRALPAIRLAHFEKLCYFPHVGIGTTTDSDYERLVRTNPSVVLKPMQQHADLLIGMIQLNANDVAASLDALNRWLRDGPMLGVYFPGGG